MNRVSCTILALLLVALPAMGRAPRKPPLTTYSVLWTQSPFTSKPPPMTGEEEPEENPFEDWALGGVSSVGGRRLITLFHRKEAGKQLIVDTGDPKSEFKVLEVAQDPDDFKKTTVKISKGGQTGSVTYDDKLLAGRKVASAKVQAQKAAMAKVAAAKAAQAAARAKAGRPGRAPAAGGARQPRMRVIPQPKKK